MYFQIVEETPGVNLDSRKSRGFFLALAQLRFRLAA
jgi:hypothetical protein